MTSAAPSFSLHSFLKINSTPQRERRWGGQDWKGYRDYMIYNIDPTAYRNVWHGFTKKGASEQHCQ